ncbi:MAG TPA: hypothetical protein VKA09_03180 [Nitrososphaeraceae archaeon]|nr:hypothetical protein [Nitrososphaeraceae archaeon]
MTHRNVPIIRFTMTAGDPRTRIIIANDPTKGDPLEDNGDFSERLEINLYCLNRRNDVLNLI